jgi:hypothetical protein
MTIVYDDPSLEGVPSLSVMPNVSASFNSDSSTLGQMQRYGQGGFDLNKLFQQSNNIKFNSKTKKKQNKIILYIEI